MHFLLLGNISFNIDHFQCGKSSCENSTAIKLALKTSRSRRAKKLINQGSLNRVNTCLKCKRLRVQSDEDKSAFNEQASWREVKEAETAKVLSLN